jgi:beta-N-acetylhexosaminidase
MNLAPDADVAVAGGPGQGRAFADTPSAVARAVRASVDGYASAGVAAAVGPFPGDGAASQDPSAGPAPVGLGLDQLRDADMTPFAAVASGRGAAPAMQMSNAIYVAFDSVTPATILPDAVKELRDRLGFEGTIVSADLVSTTATTGGSVGEAAVAALKAGVDMLLVPGGAAQQDEAYRAVVAAVASRAVPADRVVSALRRIAALRRLTRDARQPIQAQG